MRERKACRILRLKRWSSWSPRGSGGPAEARAVGGSGTERLVGQNGPLGCNTVIQAVQTSGKPAKLL